MFLAWLSCISGTSVRNVRGSTVESITLGIGGTVSTILFLLMILRLGTDIVVASDKMLIFSMVLRGMVGMSTTLLAAFVDILENVQLTCIRLKITKANCGC